MEAVRIETARRALGRGVRDPAKRAASVAANAVTRIEDGADARPSTIDALRGAIEAAGVLSVTGGGEGPDVGLRRGAQPS